MWKRKSADVKRVVRYVGFALIAGALVWGAASCETGSDSTGSVEGEWKYVFDGGYERYTITATHLTKYENWGDRETTAFSGAIQYKEQFNVRAGVIIIKYTEGEEKQWFDYTNDPPTSVNRPGDYYGIYYSELTDSSVKIADTVDLTNWGPTETTTLADAKTKFTAGNTSNFVDWSMTQPQIRQ
jgi:hypothetical protein